MNIAVLNVAILNIASLDLYQGGGREGERQRGEDNQLQEGGGEVKRLCRLILHKLLLKPNLPLLHIGRPC